MSITDSPRTAPLIAAAALCLVLTVSCAKKENAAEITLPPPAEVKKTVAETPAEETSAAKTPAAETPAAEEATIATIEVLAPADTAKKALKKAAAPAAAPEPTEPPEPQPTLVLVQIAGPKVITAGKTFSLTGDADGQGKAHAYAWRFKSGSDVINMNTESPRVTTTLNKAGDWEVSCKIMWKDKAISSMAITINVNPAAEE